MISLDRAYSMILAVESINLFHSFKFKEKDTIRIVKAAKVAIRNQTYY